MKVLPLILFSALIGRAQVHILTAHGNNQRTNANLEETRLSPASVTPQTFGKTATLSVDGQVYAQPLYVSGLTVPGSGPMNLVFVATMHNSVYAFNADAAGSPAPLWHVNLGTPVPAGALFGQYGDIAWEVGALGTPAIDLQRGVMYVVSDTMQNAVPVFQLHALGLVTGAEKLNGPVAIAGSAGATVFDPWQHIQRPGLLLANGAVYVGFGSHGDMAPWHGWLMSYDASDVSRQLGVYVATPSAQGGSLWRDVAADDAGILYSITGNGDYDGASNLGQSFVKLKGTAPAAAAHFTPGNWKELSDNDLDLSAGPALVPGTRTLVGADKLGQLYLLNADSMLPVGAGAVQVSGGLIFSIAVWARTGGTYVYTQGWKEPAQCFEITADGIGSTPVSATGASLQSSRIGMTVSANGGAKDSGILWETDSDNNETAAGGTLHAFDASNLANELWSSQMNPDRDRLGTVAKFASPTVVNGRVYVPTFSNTVVVYGLVDPPPGDETPVPAIAAVTNAASYAADAVSPGLLVAIFGTNLGPAVPAGLQLNESGMVSTSVAGTQVLFDGVPAPIVFTSAKQVNAVAPFGLTGGSPQVQVVYRGTSSESFVATAAPASPGVLSADGSGSGPAVAANQDGTANTEANPAAAGSVVTLYATGAGQLTPAGLDGTVVKADALPVPVLGVTASMGGIPAEVLYAGGSPGIVEGVIQVNLRIPSGLRAGAAPLVLRVGERPSQAGLTLAVRP